MLYIPFPDWISPEVFPGSGLPFRWYAMMYLVAFVITYLLFKVQVKQRRLALQDDDVMNFFFWAIVGLLIGGRLFATTIYDVHGTYLREPWLIFWPFDEDWNFTGLAGMSYHGGLVGIVVAVMIYARVKKIKLLDWADMLVYAVPLGYTFGRIGNFINGELWGRVSSAPWAVLFDRAPPLSTSEPWVVEMAQKAGIAIAEGVDLVNLPRHPSQLYEAFFEGIFLWLILWFVFKPRRKFTGQGVAQYLIGYGVARFAVEYLREPDKGLDYVIALGPSGAPTELFTSLLNISMGQILSSFMIVGGVILWLVRWQRWKQNKAGLDFTLTLDLEDQPTAQGGSPVKDPEARAREAKERRKLRKKLK